MQQWLALRTANFCMERNAGAKKEYGKCSRLEDGQVERKSSVSGSLEVTKAHTATHDSSRTRRFTSRSQLATVWLGSARPHFCGAILSGAGGGRGRARPPSH